MASIMQACDRCHRRKSKCDKIHPRCGPCSKAGTSCAYSDKSKEQLYRKDVVERLEKKNRQLEIKVSALTERLTSLQAAQTQPASGATPGLQADPPIHTEGRGYNDIANEVSFLSTYAGGDRQFLGPASGLLFANIVRASLLTPAGYENNSTVASVHNGPGPGSALQGKPDWTIDDTNIPPLPLARQLINAYLAHDHLCYPCLHPDSVRYIVDAIYQDASYYRKHAFEAFVFDMLLAIGTSQVHKFNWQALPDAETHHMRAMLWLNAVLSRGGLHALQAMLLLCQFRLSSSTKDESGSLWHLVGVAARMSLEMGLHKESVYLLNTPAAQIEECDGRIPENELQEVRRRCFWCVFALDRIVSITLGRPLAICWEDIDAKYPQVDIGDAISPSYHSNKSVAQDSSNNIPNSRTAIFVHIVRYRALCGKFLTSLHRSSRTAAQPEPELRKIRDELAQELEAWRADTQSLDLPEMDLSSPITEARSSFRSKAWYEMLYHNAVLLLYRPTQMLAPSDVSGDIPRIFSAAKQSITLYAYLFRSRKINFSWNVLHAVFMAGLTYVYAVSRHIRLKRNEGTASASMPGILVEDPTIVEIVNDCRACSQVLVAVSERCNAQKNCHEVFDRLSDALLADAVDLISGGQARTSMRNTSNAHMSYSSSAPSIMDDTLDHSSATQGGDQGRVTTRSRAQPQNNLVSHDTYSSFPGSTTGAAPLAADSALRDCFPDLQQIYDAHWGDDAILQLSMDWLDDVNLHSGFI